MTVAASVTAVPVRLRWCPDWFRPTDFEWICLPAGRIALRDVLPGAPTSIEVWRNGARIEPVGSRWEIDAGEHDSLVVAARPTGIDPITILIAVAVSFAASFVLSKLIRPPKQSEDTGDEGPTYGFDGLTSTRTEGRPIQMPYGYHRAAGTILNESVENPRTPRGPSRYVVQIGFGHGPIAAIGAMEVNTADASEPMTSVPSRTIFSAEGVQVDGDPAENLEGIMLVGRLGTTDQDPVQHFDFVEQQASVDVELKAPESATKDPQTHLVTTWTDSQADQDKYWSNYGVAFDLPEEAEYFRATIQFPSGYFTTSSGAVDRRSFALLVRYIELDGDGRPITTGGDFGDGYVRPTYWTTVLARAQSFSMDFGFPLLDARTWSAPATRGTSLRVDGTNFNSKAEVATPSVPWSDSTALSAFTIACWVSLWDLAQGGFEDMWMVASQKTGSTGGFRLIFKRKTFTVAAGTSVTAYVPVLEMPGSNLSGDEFFEGHDNSSRLPRFRYVKPGGGSHGFEHRRHHVAFTYADRASVDGVNDRIRLYVDGDLYYETFDDIQLKGSTGTLTIGRDSTITIGSGRPAYGEIDELWIARQELTPTEIRRAYNKGDGLQGTVTTGGNPDEERLRFVFDTPTNLVFGYNFDENLGTGSTAQSFDTLYNNDAVLSGQASLDGIELVKRIEPDNLFRRARYRIEVARNIADSTDKESFDDRVTWQRVSWATEQRQSFPSVSLLSARIQASEAVNTRAPEITANVRGRLCPIWTGTDPVLPSFVRAWTRNPAWIVLDIILTEKVGLGEYFDRTDVNVIEFQEWADYCDERIYDLREHRLYGDESATTTTPAVTRMRYDVSVGGEPNFDGRGRIQVWLDGPPPVNWGVGKFVAWHGEATASGFVDHNIPADETGGYEIANMTPGGGSSWVVSVYWDRLDEGDPWTDGQWLDLMAGLDFTPYVGIYEGRILRHTYDAVHDTAEDAWDVIQQIASVGRAIVFFDGKRVRVKATRTRSPVGVVSMGSIIEDSFELEYAGPSSRPNAYTIEFLDETQNWERRPAYVEHESVANATATSKLRQESVFVRGITRREAALRHGKFLVNVDQLVIRTGTFKASIDAVHYEPGDVLVLQHDVLPWGKGGRVLEESTDPAEIVLDREVTIGAAGTWFVDVSHPSQNGFFTRGVTTAAGTYPAGTALTLDAALPFTPTHDLRYVFYEQAERKLVEITSFRLASDMEVEVEWAEYVEAVYDDTPTVEPALEDVEPVDSWGTQDLADSWGTQDEADAWGTQA